MTTVDLLSDTVYRDQARDRLDKLLEDMDAFPVQRSQIYGLRQIARQQPLQVTEFAEHQRGRAERKKENAGATAQLRLESEIKLWSLVKRLCDSTTGWSVQTEAKRHLPDKLSDENIPVNRPGMTSDERRARNQLRGQQRKWITAWEMNHVPAFFERFCTHALYRLGTAGNES